MRAAVIVAALLASATFAHAGPAGYLGLWEAESGKVRFELRSAADGSYEAVVAWAAADAAPEMRRRVGGVLVRGLRWDDRTGKFARGVAVQAASGPEYPCELRPGESSTLELRVSVGFVVKATTWRRPRGACLPSRACPLASLGPRPMERPGIRPMARARSLALIRPVRRPSCPCPTRGTSWSGRP